MNELVASLPCGCRRGIIKRMIPSFDEKGAPKLEDDAFVMIESEDIEETYCDEHTKVLIERQHAVQKALGDGKSPEEAARLFLGASPFPLLNAHDDEPLE